MRKFFSFIKTWFNRSERLAYTIPEFTHRHRDLLIIVCDPKSDEIFMSYNDHNVRGVIGEKGGKKNQHIIRQVLKYGRFKVAATPFFMELATALGGYTKKTKF